LFFVVVVVVVIVVFVVVIDVLKGKGVDGGDEGGLGFIWCLPLRVMFKNN